MTIGGLRAQGVTINLGTTLGENHYQSDGTFGLTGYTGALGSFGGFMPTAFNTDEWLANWTAFAENTFSSENYLGVGSVLTSNTPFTFGSQIYLWVYDATTLTPTATAQWFLVTDDSTDGNTSDDWTWPEAPGSQVNTGIDLVVSCDSADEQQVLFGGLEGTQAGGSFTATPGDMCIQTHGVTTTVPEPSVVGLLAGALGFCLRRRRA